MVASETPNLAAIARRDRGRRPLRPSQQASSSFGLTAAMGWPQGSPEARRRASLAPSERMWRSRRTEGSSQPADQAARVGGVDVVFDGYQGDALAIEELAQLGQVAQGARELAEGVDQNALHGVHSHGGDQTLEAFSPAFEPGSLIGALQDDFPAAPGRVVSQAGEGPLDGDSAEVGGRGAGVGRDSHLRFLRAGAGWWLW